MQSTLFESTFVETANAKKIDLAAAIELSKIKHAQVFFAVTAN